METDFYADYAKLQSAHWWFVGRRRILTALLEAHVPAGGSLDILDFGCGTGAYLGDLRRFGRVTGVDGSPEAVRFCHDSGERAVQLVPPGSGLPFADDSFDLVTTLDVIEHIDDDVTALRELRRVLRSDGRLVVTVPAFMWLWGDQDEIAHHRRRYTARSLGQALDASGYAVEHMTYFNTILFPAIAAIRLVRRLVRAPQAGRSDFTVGPAALNGVLATLFSLERGAVKRRRLPVGVSLLALARPR